MVRQIRQTADAYGCCSSFVPSVDRVMSRISEVSVHLLLDSEQKERTALFTFTNVTRARSSDSGQAVREGEQAQLLLRPAPILYLAS
jgi:hypothetical protein